MKFNLPVLVLTFIMFPVISSVVLNQEYIVSSGMSSLSNRADFALSTCLYFGKSKRLEVFKFEECKLSFINTIDIRNSLKRVKKNDFKVIEIPLNDYYFSNFKTAGPDAKPQSDFFYLDFLETKVATDKVALGPTVFFKLTSIFFARKQKRLNIFDSNKESWTFLSFRKLPKGLKKEISRLKKLGTTFKFQFTETNSPFFKRNRLNIENEISSLGDL